ncbi:hypothetical protein GTW51_09900 [Aurantimonas aggregata]|uniref:Uncharacterized protein n=1 Tax=Aurantimonas aggregata TaxID=2047720 RepID=A0A6L9MGR6_9HYPH|nr:CDC27 family protein [Aurantimonas aggregata]NDV87014.1 hypothetical protein [Aurantimonas aggregata]
MLNPNLAQAQAVLGDITMFWDRNYDTGLGLSERALAIDPDDTLARHWHAAALMGVGRYEKAAAEIAVAREREPMSRSIIVTRAMILLGLGHHEEARDTLRQLAANEPGYRSPYRFLAFAELARGDHLPYLQAWETRFTLRDDDNGRAVIRAGRLAYEGLGADGIAEAMLAAARELPEGTIEPYFLAHLLALAGDGEGAAAQLGLIETR